MTVAYGSSLHGIGQLLAPLSTLGTAARMEITA